ncbi:M50 family metallopeptidase [Glycomyces harbinensis]|uniref:Peptidase M50B-like n=1 Tax=Glycomyces harbinensis TaxID=58114 RepID=A0A1G6RJX1_9ACTN|nr:M50 family metallopeptidase [Glycomyces harbinensis]SDD04950.1 Peptidase M50B-like [Glycomyces harbinensis]
MEPIETVFDTLTQTQSAPPVWVMLVCLAAAAAAVLSAPVWRWTRGLVTIAHEGGHALMAVLMRRRLTGIRLHADTSGLTFSRGRPTGFGAAMTLLAGYLAPAALGLLAAALTGAGRIVLLLWITLVLLAVMLVFIRNWYGALALIVVGAGVFAATWYGNAIVQTVAGYLGAWLLLLGAVKPVMELGSRRRGGRGSGQSDADQLAGITPLPAGSWIFFFTLGTIAAAVWGTFMLLPLSEWLDAL